MKLFYNTRNMFLKQFGYYSILITSCFLISGILFTHQVNKYALEEKKVKLEETVIKVADMTEMLFNNHSEYLQKFYNFNVAQISREDNAGIIVCDASGNIILYADNHNLISKDSKKIDSNISASTLYSGEYSEIGTLNGIFKEQSHIFGRRAFNAYGEALVFVATPAKSIETLTSNVIKTFLVVVIITLMVMLVMTYIITEKMTKPLKNMATASKYFAKGDFSVRVCEINECDEIDELAISFNNMASSLEDMEEISEGFVANVSHELKTPITSISGFADGLLDGTIENHTKYLEIISSESKRLSRLVTKMLESSKVRSLQLSKSNFEFAEMSTQIILSFERELTEKNITVDINYPDSIMLFADKDRIFQVAYNIVHNAVKFVSPFGILKIEIKKDKNFYIFSVYNTAESLSPNDIKYLFDKFYKVDKSRSIDTSGAGLGLYICKAIIDKHGGEIYAESNDEGVNITFTIPI